MNLQKTRRSRAFTLVEIMIAVAIFSMVVGAIYSTWSLILRASRTGQEAAAQVQRQRIALRTIEDSLTCIQSFQASMQYYSFIVQNGGEPVLSFAARLPATFPRNGKFGDFDLRRVTFTVEPGPDSEKDLVLRQNPILMTLSPDEQQHPLILARHVKNFVIECWNTNAMTWDDEWDLTNVIPPMVRISLVLGGNANAGQPGASTPELSVTRIVALPSTTLPSGLQVPGRK